MLLVVAQSVKNSAANAGDTTSTPGLGRAPGEVNGNPLQYSAPENSHEQRSLEGYSPGVARVGHNLMTKTTTLEIWKRPVKKIGNSINPKMLV